MGDSPQRIWIEAGDDCPYFYEESELAEVGSPVTEYIRADLCHRPAPAATDTGLVTVEYQVRSKLNGHWVKDNFLSQQLSPDTERRELVTRSQAGAIIAELQAKAKDYREYSERLEKRLESEEATRSQAVELLAAERDETERLADDYQAIREQLHRGWQECCALKADNAAERAEKEIAYRANERCLKEISKLRADNAAQAARIKELDRCHEGTIDLCNQKTAQIEALEAKLAAAEKALEPFVSFFNEAMKGFTEGYAERTPSDKPVLGWNNAYLLMRHFIEARAVLGGTPS